MVLIQLKKKLARIFLMPCYDFFMTTFFFKDEFAGPLIHGHVIGSPKNVITAPYGEKNKWEIEMNRTPVSPYVIWTVRVLFSDLIAWHELFLFQWLLQCWCIKVCGVCVPPKPGWTTIHRDDKEREVKSHILSHLMISRLKCEARGPLRVTSSIYRRTKTQRGEGGGGTPGLGGMERQERGEGWSTGRKPERRIYW